ncbi:acyl--CoA ligase [Oscillospiraceae bacterium CM]|nr:acyl--CoA ligase [Oscillospiraceae bacterium CM]
MAHIYAFLSDSARRHPDKTFVTDRGRDWTFGEISRRSAAIAGGLMASGVQAGSRVLLYFDNCAEYIASYFAVLLLNAIVVPVHKNLTIETRSHIICQTQPKMILTSHAFQRRLHDVDGDIVRVVDFSAPMDAGHQGVPDEPEEADDAPALILYTSGTTRLPKGVTLTHRNLSANTASILAYLDLTADDALLAVVNFAYSYGNSLLLTHAKAGARLVLENATAYPAQVLKALLESRVTGFSTVGSYLAVLLRQGALSANHLRFLRYVTFAGESTNADDLKQLASLAPGLRIFVMYGQTEASARLSYLDPALLFDKPGSIGKAIPGVVLRVVTEDGHPARPGEWGELVAAGENIMKGYWNDEEATRDVLVAGWLQTGDLAYTDEDGFLYIKGRKDDIIKHLGHRISPAEIEAAVNSCPKVLESAVVAVLDGSALCIKAFVVLKEDTGAGEIEAHVRRLLPSYKRPHIYEIIDALPRTASGKIKRSDLRSGII